MKVITYVCKSRASIIHFVILNVNSYSFFYSILIFSIHERLVGKIDVVVDKLRVDRSRVRLAEVEVGDEVSIFRINIQITT